MTWMPLPPADRFLSRSESSEVTQIRTQSGQPHGRRAEEKRAGLWILVGLFLVSLLLLLLIPVPGL